MTLQSSGNPISMSDIAEEKKGSGLPSGGYWQNISLRGCSVDSVTDFSFYNGDSIITADYPGTPNSAAPHGMAEFYGYSQFAWGTPILPSGTNVAKIFDMFQERRNGGDTCVVCSFNMSLNTSTKSISYSVVGTDDGGGFNPSFTVGNGGSISYSGTLSSLEARFVHTGATITSTSSGSSDNGKILELFSNTGHISNTDISNNAIVSSGSVVTSNNDISSGASGTYRSLRTSTGNMSVALAAASDDAPTVNDDSYAAIDYSGSSDSIAIQLRANGNIVVTLYSRAAGTSFSMAALSSEEGSS